MSEPVNNDPVLLMDRFCLRTEGYDAHIMPAPCLLLRKRGDKTLRAPMHDGWIKNVNMEYSHDVP
jgi:hypothetical protein